MVDAIVAETFIGIKNGDKYPLDKCPCGCGIDKSGTALTHDMARKIVEKGKELRVEKAKLLADSLNAMILSHIEKQNADYVAEHGPKEKKIKILDWDKSETVRVIKWIGSRLHRQGFILHRHRQGRNGLLML